MGKIIICNRQRIVRNMGYYVYINVHLYTHDYRPWLEAQRIFPLLETSSHFSPSRTGNVAFVAEDEGKRRLITFANKVPSAHYSIVSLASAARDRGGDKGPLSPQRNGTCVIMYRIFSSVWPIYNNNETTVLHFTFSFLCQIPTRMLYMWPL